MDPESIKKMGATQRFLDNLTEITVRVVNVISRACVLQPFLSSNRWNKWITGWVFQSHFLIDCHFFFELTYIFSIYHKHFHRLDYQIGCNLGCNTSGLQNYMYCIHTLASVNLSRNVQCSYRCSYTLIITE